MACWLSSHPKKLYKGMELCIPETYALEIVRSYHFFNGHPGVDKLVKGLKLRYQFSNGYSVMDMANRVKRGCVVCQACEHPNWAMKGRYDMTPSQPLPVYVLISLPYRKRCGKIKHMMR